MEDNRANLNWEYAGYPSITTPSSATKRRQRRNRRSDRRMKGVNSRNMQGLEHLALSPRAYIKADIFGKGIVTDQVVGLDCEMVGVGPGGQRSVLARVSVIDSNGVALLDTFVRVQEKVTDFRTFVSGVRAEDLDGPGAMDFGACRKRVIQLMKGKILVGHGLKNDLEVLKIVHPWHLIRDTSLYEPFMKLDYRTGSRRPQKLRTLALAQLGRIIQEEGMEHDSIIDAVTAMDLYKSVKVDWDYWMNSSKTAFSRGPFHSPHRQY